MCFYFAFIALCAFGFVLSVKPRDWLARQNASVTSYFVIECKTLKLEFHGSSFLVASPSVTSETPDFLVRC